jgi:hypothetical protein
VRVGGVNHHFRENRLLLVIQDGGAKLSPTNEIVTIWLLVVEDPVIEAEQAVTIKHESVMVDMDAVLAPEGIKTEYDVSQALAVCAKQELLGEDEGDEDNEDEAVVVLDDDCSVEDDFVSSSPSSPRSWPISARVSVKFSISSRSGTSALTESTRFLTTSLAQLISFAAS